MDMGFKVVEVTLQCRPTCKERGKVMSSEEAYKTLFPAFKEGTIKYREYTKVLYLNQTNEVITYNTISEGGISETAVGVRMILQGALLTSASQVLLCHNHLSGNLHPSTQDDMLTERIEEACEIPRYHFTDHLIIPNNGYYGYRDGGRI